MSAQHDPTEAPPDPLSAADRLDGVPTIAAYLGWSERKVYQAREKGWSVPIRKRDGIGIYAFRSELLQWLTAEETLPAKSHAA